MLTLTMLRHAKSSWGDPLLRDKNRPLNARGKSQAQQMGEHLSQQRIDPNLIICSSAKRARQTLKQVSKKWQTDAQAVFEDQLYLASSSTIVSLLEKYGNNADHIMIIGHNPGFHKLASSLADTGNANDLVNLSQRYPTGTLCVIKSNAKQWRNIDNEPGELASFTSPKSLKLNT
ncbi:MAG: histidine phosphatase family protein [bacterium]|nr:histidine phosphatase family protein [bacterium]